MKTPVFQDGSDQTTFEPFWIEDNRDDPDNPDVRLGFDGFEQLEESVGITPDNFSLCGHEMEEILSDIIDSNNLIQHSAGTHDGGYFDNSEGSVCYFHFNHLDDAIRVAEFCLALFSDIDRLTSIMASHGYRASDAEDAD